MGKDLRMRSAYVGVGSNLGDRVGNCRSAINQVASLPGVSLEKCSSFYETRPVDIDSDRWFVNAVFQVSTSLEADRLLDELLAIETKMGRDRSLGPDRIIDLDLLWVEGISRRPIIPGDLELPHPRFSSRCFVLVPWAEIAPDLVVDGLNATLLKRLEALNCSGSDIWKMEDF